MGKLSLLIFSSSEDLNVARAIQTELDYDMDVELWNQNVFQLSQYPIESILEKLDSTDLASFVFLPNDIASIRGENKIVVRDNVLFELGLAIGKLGRERVSFVIPRGSDLHIPTDLAGINKGTFEYPRPNLQASVAPYCGQIRLQADKIKISFPATGKYGENILSDSVVRIKGTSSFRANIPRGKKAIIRIERLGEAKYGFEVSTGAEWIRFNKKDHDNIQYITAEGPCVADNLFRVFHSGIIHIDVFDGNESFPPILSKDVCMEKQL